MRVLHRHTRDCEIKERTEERKAYQVQSESLRIGRAKKSVSLVGAAKISEKLARWRRLQQRA